jgi:predicted lipoprotein with Yx(FWY)xxD motif
MNDNTSIQPSTRRPARSRRWLARGALITTAGVILAACGGGGSRTSSGAPTSSAAASGGTTSSTVLTMTSAKYGRILTDAKGFALYTYTADNPGGSGCTGSCLVLWPPLVLPAGAAQPVAGAGVAQLASISRPEGLQVTYQGHPLYTYLDDRQPGQVTGQDVVDSGGVWLLATIGSATAATSGTTSTSPPAAPSAATTPGAPTTSPPAAQPSIRQPPATQPPATQPPATRPPSTNPPTTLEPPTSPPPTTPPTTAATTPPTTAPGGGVSY